MAIGDNIPVLMECLDLVGEPLFVLNTITNEVRGNKSFQSLIGVNDTTILLESFWPGFIKSELKDEAYISKIKIADGDFASVKLYFKELEENVFLFKILSSRLPYDSRSGLDLQRREMLGELAGGIAHDINNIVTGVLGHSSFLKMTLPQTGNHVNSVSAIEEGGNRCAQLVKQILSFIKHDNGNEAVKLELKQVIEGTCNLLRGAISKKIKIITELPSEKVFIKGIEGQFSQILVNLVVNARDAIKDSGEIRVVLRVMETNEVIEPVGDVKGSESLKGRYACISVIDNGQGIPGDIIGRVFEPYFSTKLDKGTGLGLATVKEIVEHSGGVVEISSKAFIGTKVSVYLPLFDEEEEINVEKAPSPAMTKGAGRILIVDDEQSIRNVLSLSLRRLGYEVEMAASGSEAISKYIQDHYNYNLIVLDMVMPELSGRDIFFKLKELNPDVRVLICSAFASEQAIRDILENGGKGFIQKPFDVEDLAEKIQSCIS